MTGGILSDFEAIAARAEESQPVMFEPVADNSVFVKRSDLASTLGALATALSGRDREVVVLCAQAAGLVVR